MTIATPTPDLTGALEAMLVVLSDQLKTMRTATALALDYIEAAQPHAALGTLAGIETEITETACLYGTILALMRKTA